MRSRGRIIGGVGALCKYHTIISMQVEETNTGMMCDECLRVGIEESRAFGTLAPLELAHWGKGRYPGYR
jgi:hypothetical protein